MVKRARKVLCLMTAAAILATGCGTASAPTDGSEESTEAGGVKPVVNGGVVTMTVGAAEEDTELMNQIIAGFKQKYSAEAEFDISIIPMSESASKDTILNSIDEAPDVFTFADDQLAAFAAAGLLVPVENADEIAARNVEGSVEAASINDKLYAYPLTADNGYFMYYNKAYFEEADLASLDQILSVAASNGKKVTMDLTSGWYLYSFFGNTGLTLGLNDDGISNYCDWNSTENAITGVDVLNAMMAIGTNPGFQNGGDDVLGDGAANDSVIAGVSGTWKANELQEIWGDNLGAVKLPTYTVADQQVQMASYAGYKLVGVNHYSENEYWGNLFADYMTSEENQTLRFSMRGQGPSNLNAAESSDVKASVAIQAVLQQSEFASLQRVGGEYWEPAGELGSAAITGNTEGYGTQEFLDLIVEGITKSNS